MSVLDRPGVQQGGQHIEQHGDEPAPPRRIQWRYLYALIIVLCVAVGYVAYHGLFARELAREAERNRQHLETLGLSINATLQKYDELPLVIGQEQRIRNALEQPQKGALLMEANRYLAGINQVLGTDTIYVMNEHGLTLVSSNWNDPDSFVGDNYAFRPYFLGAVGQGVGRFYGIGLTSKSPGYYIAYPIKNDQKLIGVMTLKIGLADIQKTLSDVQGDLIVTNEDGVVILASDPQDRYKTTRPLSVEASERISATRQFPGQALAALQFKGVPVQLAEHSTSNDISLLAGEHYMVQAAPLGSRGWQVAQINDTREARNYAMASALAIGFALALLLISALHIYYRRRERQEKRAIYANIDARINEHTAALTDKISQLERAETVLKQTRDEAVQAGKMAVLGQMAAGITHELSQPLSAIRLYAGNTQKLMEAGRLDVAGDNIASINALVERAGAILSELKTLYRNDGNEALVAVRLGNVLQNALLVMAPFIEKAGIALNMDVGAARVMGTPGKLEQVFVNLIANAVDALAGRSDGRIDISAVVDGAQVVVTCRDNGPGIKDEQIAHMFEPFFTTKPSGQGLGLGLAITRFIVDSLGGNIACANLDGGGVAFTLHLRHAESAITP